MDEGGLAPWSPSKLYEQAFPASARERLARIFLERGEKNPWAPPDDATPEQMQEFEAYAARMLVPDERITTWIDISGEPLEAKWVAMQEHVTQLGPDFPFLAIGLETWRETFATEAFILRESRVATTPPETDLFSGIV